MQQSQSLLTTVKFGLGFRSTVMVKLWHIQGPDSAIAKPVEEARPPEIKKHSATQYADVTVPPHCGRNPCYGENRFLDEFVDPLTQRQVPAIQKIYNSVGLPHAQFVKEVPVMTQ